MSLFCFVYIYWCVSIKPFSIYSLPWLPSAALLNPSYNREYLCHQQTALIAVPVTPLQISLIYIIHRFRPKTKSRDCEQTSPILTSCCLCWKTFKLSIHSNKIHWCLISPFFHSKPSWLIVPKAECLTECSNSIFLWLNSRCFPNASPL